MGKCEEKDLKRSSFASTLILLGQCFQLLFLFPLGN